MKIATFNLRIDVASDGRNAWPFRLPSLRAFLQAEDWDAIGTQEGNLKMLEGLMPGIPRFSRIGLPRFGEDETCAILYDPSRLRKADSGTFWLSGTPDEVSRFSGSHFLRICTWAEFLPSGEEPFRMFNTHLDYASPEIRIRQIEVLLEKIRDLDALRPLPVVLTGDFNAESDDPCFLPLREFRLSGNRCFLSAAAEKGLTGRTFHGFSGTGWGNPIDHVWFSSDLRCASARIRTDSGPEGEFLSDHYPLEAHFENDPVFPLGKKPEKNRGSL